MIRSIHRQSRFTLALISAIWIGAGQALADYDPLPLHRIIGAADLIVLGTITALEKDFFLLGEHQIVDGTVAENELAVKRFKNWSGASRWTAYATGQRVLLFLGRPKKNHDGDRAVWHIVGLGAEGEMPVDGNNVYSLGPVLEVFRPGDYRIHGVRVSAYQLPLAEFLSSVVGYRGCFTFSQQVGRDGFSAIKQVCDDGALEAFRASSQLNALLVKETYQDQRGRH